jgi:hypothetical protein
MTIEGGFLFPESPFLILAPLDLAVRQKPDRILQLQEQRFLRRDRFLISTSMSRSRWPGMVVVLVAVCG